MRIYAVFSVLFLLCGLVVLGCGDSVEDSNADVLEPDGDFRFQDLPVVEGGSLIPPDKIPVITIEKTREDAENIWWKLKAAPVPSLEDLVVVVTYPEYGLGDFGPDFDLDFEVFGPEKEDARELGVQLLSIPIFENSSVEMKMPRFQVDLGLKVRRFHYLELNVLIPTLPFIPSFQLDDGYVVPQGFAFSYYLPGTPSSLEIPPKEQAQ